MENWAAFSNLYRSPGKIVSITVPTFEALTQFGAATITTKNIGEVEASYSLTVPYSPELAAPCTIALILKSKSNGYAKIDGAIAII